MLVYLNGEYLPDSSAFISPADRGFLFGDGVYEVTRSRGGRLFEWERHLRRLAYGLAGLRIALPEAERARLGDVSRRLLVENDLTAGDATVYLQVTRGAAAPRAHHFPAAAATRPTVFLAATRLAVPDEVRAVGARVVTVSDVRWSRCDLKTVNLLPNVLAKQRAVELGAHEALFVRDGVLIEGSSTNVFAVLDGELRTYPASNYILAGITREVVLELAAEARIPTRETPILVDDVGRATELFLTSTTNDVMPVTYVDGNAVGNGKPGPVARQLYDALMARMGRAAAGASADVPGEVALTRT